MAIPDSGAIMLPLLKYLASVQSATPKECVNQLAIEFQLTDDERSELLPSRKDAVFRNRVAWARESLKKAGLLDGSVRGIWSISELGRNTVKDKSLSNTDIILRGNNLPTIDSNSIENIDVFYEMKKTPKELLEESYAQIRDDLAQEILLRVKECSPNFFEKLVVDLLLTMGYGGSRSDAGKAIGQSGDGGIDGIISEDRLGLDNIYIQAKRWDDTTVGQPEIQKFVGAMAGRHGSKGVFITTSTFSKDAADYSTRQLKRIKLIDGAELARLMLENCVGVISESALHLYKMDADYFGSNEAK